MLPNVNQMPGGGGRRSNPFANILGMVLGSGGIARRTKAELDLYDAQRGIDSHYYKENVTHKADEGIRSHREKGKENLRNFDKLERRAVKQNRRLSGFNLGSDGQMAMSYQSEFDPHSRNAGTPASKAARPTAAPGTNPAPAASTPAAAPAAAPAPAKPRAPRKTAAPAAAPAAPAAKAPKKSVAPAAKTTKPKTPKAEVVEPAAPAAKKTTKKGGK